MQRNQKLVSLIYLACGFTAWLIFRELFATVWAIAHLPSPADWIMPPSEMLGVAFGVVMFVFLLRSRKVGMFTNDTLTELGKVVWPNRKETVLSTGVVSVLVAIAATILFLFDVLWGALVHVFYQG